MEDHARELKGYAGSCHCGKVRFELRTDVVRASACNCSICSRVGWLMTSVPVSQFTLLSGGDAQTDYQFGPKNMHHPFCRTCGIHTFGSYVMDGVEKIVVNVRCLEGVALEALEVQTFDGKSY